MRQQEGSVRFILIITAIHRQGSACPDSDNRGIIIIRIAGSILINGNICAINQVHFPLAYGELATHGQRAVNIRHTAYRLQ